MHVGYKCVGLGPACVLLGGSVSVSAHKPGLVDSVGLVVSLTAPASLLLFPALPQDTSSNV